MKTANIGNIELEHPVMNAAGTCKLFTGPNSVAEFVKMPFSAIMVGSITVYPREAHTTYTTYATTPDFSLNAMGLPNPGIDYYREYLPKMVKLAHLHGKKLFVSIAGANLTEYYLLAKFVINSGADLLELNLSCPNLWKNGVQERIICFDFKEVHAMLHELNKFKRKIPISVKMSPFSDPRRLEQFADLLTKYPCVSAVTAVNTFPNAWGYVDGKPMIEFGLAGMSGPALKPIALGQVYQLWRALPADIKIIGVGGISECCDVLDFLDVGAEAVQVGTAFINGGAAAIKSIVSGLELDD